MKHILIISQEFPPAVGGAGVVAQQNAMQLAAMGNKVTVITRDWGEIADNSYKVIKIGGIRKLWPFFMANKIKKLNLNNFDSIILNDVGAAFVWKIFVNDKKHFSKLSIYLHGGEVDTVINKPKGYLYFFKFTDKYIKLLNQCKSIIAVSEYMKTYFLSSIAKDRLENEIKVVYAGVDNNIFKPLVNNIREELKIRPDNYIVISTGRITEDKGYPDMLEVFKSLYETDKNFVWLIIGQGPFLNELKTRVKFEGLEKNVITLGPVPRNTLAKYYSAASLLLLTARVSESFGLVYVEAQMCGCPAIGTNNYGVKEAILNGKSGFLVDSKTEVLSLLKNKDYLNLNKKEIVDFAEKFSLKSQAKILSDII